MRYEKTQKYAHFLFAFDPLFTLLSLTKLHHRFDDLQLQTFPWKILDPIFTETTQQENKDEMNFFRRELRARICIHPFISLSHCF